MKLSSPAACSLVRNPPNSSPERAGCGPPGKDKKRRNKCCVSPDYRPAARWGVPAQGSGCCRGDPVRSSAGQERPELRTAPGSSGRTPAQEGPPPPGRSWREDGLGASPTLEGGHGSQWDKQFLGGGILWVRGVEIRGWNESNSDAGLRGCCRYDSGVTDVCVVSKNYTCVCRCSLQMLLLMRWHQTSRHLYNDRHLQSNTAAARSHSGKWKWFTEFLWFKLILQTLQPAHLSPTNWPERAEKLSRVQGSGALRTRGLLVEYEPLTGL